MDIVRGASVFDLEMERREEDPHGQKENEKKEENECARLPFFDLLIPFFLEGRNFGIEEGIRQSAELILVHKKGARILAPKTQ